MSTTLKAFVSYDTDSEHNTYVKEVKKNNYAIIGSGSESPLEVGTYKVSVIGGKDSKFRIAGTTNGNSWALFLMAVKVLNNTTYSGIIDRVPFNPDTLYKANNRLNIEVYLDKNGKRRSKIVE
tara:strand:+ start:2376 stop:2744 length:369 start_codon:yes stop_codon:yes gene_type:complete